MLKTLLDIIISFGKIGFVALGGGHSMIKLIEYETVINRHWLMKEDFIQMVGTTFLFPGLTAVKLSALIGYKAAGIPGMVVAVLSLNLPGIVLVFVGYSFLSQHDSPIARKLLICVQYGALALLAAAAFSIAEGVLQYHFSWALLALTMLFLIALVGFNASPFWGLLVFIPIAYFLVTL